MKMSSMRTFSKTGREPRVSSDMQLHFGQEKGKSVPVFDSLGHSLCCSHFLVLATSPKIQDNIHRIAQVVFQVVRSNAAVLPSARR